MNALKGQPLPDTAIDTHAHPGLSPKFETATPQQGKVWVKYCSCNAIPMGILEKYHVFNGLQLWLS